MKRTIPLLITAISGLVLLVSFFIPLIEGWGEKAAIWFDILAAVAFILGGGNLIKIHLKKISDQGTGWGFSAVTITAFLVTLIVGLGKFGADPATQPQGYGESRAPLRLADFPMSFSVSGKIPAHAVNSELPYVVRRQLSEKDQVVTFRGWLRPNQVAALTGFQDELEWRCMVEKLAKEAVPPKPLKGKIGYDEQNSLLTFKGQMTEDDQKELRTLDTSSAWTTAVDSLFDQSQGKSSVDYETLPSGFKVPGSLEKTLEVDKTKKQMTLTGPMSAGQRDALAAQFPVARPLPKGSRRDAFVKSIEEHGQPLNKQQREQLDKLLDGGWTREQLIDTLDAAGEPQEVDKTACELLDEKRAAEAKGEVPDLKLIRIEGEPTRLNDAQKLVIESFTDNIKMSSGELVEQLKAAGTFTASQASALDRFLSQNPTEGVRNRTVFFALLNQGSLSQEQKSFLLGDARQQFAWRQIVGELFIGAHSSRYAWSGEYRGQGSPFWWIYEYALKPLTATMFAMLAFYVASAAFRAFRAKNTEAILLLGTAFIILLGRTAAGSTLTAWLPDSLAGLKLDNLTVWIMMVPNIAGNRAIMIGIALGIAATSLKVLLGVDRSYLGSQEE